MILEFSIILIYLFDTRQYILIWLRVRGLYTAFDMTFLSIFLYVKTPYPSLWPDNQSENNMYFQTY